MTTHIAGHPVRVGTVRRQRCGWCGELLDETDLARVAVPVGQDGEPPTWPVGVFITVDRGPVRVLMYVSDDGRGSMPDDACVLASEPAVPQPDAESAGAVLARLGTDASAWAAEFQRRYPGIDPAAAEPGSHLHGWFANAIEAGRTAGYGEAKREHIPGWPVPDESNRIGYCGACGRGPQDIPTGHRPEPVGGSGT